MRRQVASVVFTASLSIAGTAVAQVPPDLAGGRLQVGRKVAITDEQGARITGRVTGWRPTESPSEMTRPAERFLFHGSSGSRKSMT